MSKLELFFTLLTFSIHFVFDKALASNCNRSSLEIKLPQGNIKGSYDINKSQIKFLGIPYASVQKRFEPPGKPPTWNGTLNANRETVSCKQYHQLWNVAVGTEDCLILNVFTPNFQVNKPFPVMVFIHGGGFYYGSNTQWVYNPKYLVREEVIVVTINYRLGAFGFLCLGLKEAPGNVGLKDQIAALTWIKNNIKYFGGNPNSVTLFGESYGGTAINYFILSHSAEGLFHRAILESGSLMTPAAFSYTPIEIASKVALRLGHNTMDSEELLNVFRNKTADDIVEASYFAPGDHDPFAPFVFEPCIETAITCDGPLIREEPSNLLKEKGLNISVIIGFNNKEGIEWATYYYPITSEKVKENLQNIVPRNLFFENEVEKQSFVNDIESVYFRNGTAQNNLIDYFTDAVIRYPLTVVSEAFCKNPNRSVYNYYFTHDSIRNVKKQLTNLSSVPGASHADELFYLFDPVVFNLLPPNSKDRAVITNLAKLWTSFAKTGVPTTSNFTWHPCGDKLNFIEINEDIMEISLPNNDRIDFWRETYKKYGRK